MAQVQLSLAENEMEKGKGNDSEMLQKHEFE